MTTEQSEKPALEYEHASARFATRRQFRWLMALLLLNLLITVQTAYWPGLAGSFKSQWSDYQQHRRQRAARQQAMNLTQPPSHVVWDENPETAAALLAAPGYNPIRVDRLEDFPFLANWPRGAAANIPPVADAFYRDQFNPTYHHAFPNLGGQRVVEPGESALILMHAFRSPAGEDRLIYVYVQGKLNIDRGSLPLADRPAPRRIPTENPFSATVKKELSIIAVPCRLPAPGDDALPTALFDERTTLVIHPDSDPREVRWTWTPPAAGQPEQIRLLGGGHLRLYAGQPDPADPTHFTIRYDLDARPGGTIHGHLKPTGAIDLHPDHGTLVGTRWDPTTP